MRVHAAITVLKSREEVERLWRASEHAVDATVTFRDAPGDRGTEIHAEVDGGGVLSKLKGGTPHAQLKNDLRRFKQLVETGEIPRSDGVPEGERVGRKLKQRPAQPLDASELDKAGVL